jgi:hypothetical protein
MRQLTTIEKTASWFLSVGACLGMLYTFLVWAWSMHNTVLVDTVTAAVEPLIENDREALRGVYAQRINNYRKKECMGDFTSAADLEEAMAKYRELVGRDIRDRDCATL